MPSKLLARAAITLSRALALFLVASLYGCGSGAPYYLVESRLVQSDFRPGQPDVTDTPDYRVTHHLIKLVALQPPDGCADRGMAGSVAAAELELGVLRTRCGVEMAQLERALARAGYRVVSWGALHHLSASEEIPVRAAARQLGVDALFQVNALELIELRPHRDARWERRFYRATETGERTEPAHVERARRSEFEALIEPRERQQIGGTRIGAAINVSVVSVPTGATIWFYEWTRVEDAETTPVLAVLADCDDDRCRALVSTAQLEGDGLVDRSSASVAPPRDPEGESQAIFQALVRDLVTDLAERFAGTR